MILKLIVVSILWLLVQSCLCEAKVVWDKEINEFKTSLSIGNNDNLYNQVEDPVSASFLDIQAHANYLKLFEGFGFSLPLSVNRKVYRNISDLSHLDFSLNPNIQFFYSDQVEFNFNLKKSHQNILTGSEGAEFTPKKYQQTKYFTDAIAFDIFLGRAPEQAFLNIDIGRINKKQKFRALTISDIKTNNLALLFGYKVSEDTYALLNSSYKEEKTLIGDSQLIEIGGGLKSAFGGSHAFEAIIGLYTRKGSASSKGHFWKLHDQWTISEQLMLDIVSNRQSVVSNVTESFSQITTNNEVSAYYKLNKQHLFNISIFSKRIELEQSDRLYKKYGTQLSWKWSLLERFQIENSAIYSTVDDSLQNHEFNALELKVLLEYLL